MTDRRRQPVTRDPELGPMRWCRKCQEWWPDDWEFWTLGAKAGEHLIIDGRRYHRRHDVKVCRACRHKTPLARTRLMDRRSAPPRKYSTARPCAICLTVLTTERMCHGCAGRTIGPLTVDMLQRWGLVPQRVESVA